MDEPIENNEDPFEEFLIGCSLTSSQNQTQVTKESQNSIEFIKEKLEEFGKIDRLSYKAEVGHS